MTADGGFLSADVSVRMLADPAVRTLVREGRPWAVLAYLAVVLESWSRNERVGFADAVGALPRDWPSAIDDELPHLVRVGLLHGDLGLIPAATWERHNGPAARRKALAQERSARMNDARWSPARSPRRSPARSPRKESTEESPSVRPSVSFPNGKDGRATDDVRRVK